MRLNNPEWRIFFLFFLLLINALYGYLNTHKNKQKTKQTKQKKNIIPQPIDLRKTKKIDQNKLFNNDANDNNDDDDSKHLEKLCPPFFTNFFSTIFSPGVLYSQL